MGHMIPANTHVRPSDAVRGGNRFENQSLRRTLISTMGGPGREPGRLARPLPISSGRSRLLFLLAIQHSLVHPLFIACAFALMALHPTSLAVQIAVAT